MFDMTINIKTDEYEIKLGRWDNSKTAFSLRIGFPGSWVGKDVLLIPIVDDDLIQIKELDDETYLISIYALEMFKKTVNAQNKDRPQKGGRVYLSKEYMGCNILIIPVE